SSAPVNKFSISLNLLACVPPFPDGNQYQPFRRQKRVKPTARTSGSTGQQIDAICPPSHLIVRVIYAIRVEEPVAFRYLIPLSPGTQKIERPPEPHLVKK